MEFLLLLYFMFTGCHQDTASEDRAVQGVEEYNRKPHWERDYRGDMRDFVIGLGKYAKAQRSDFVIIPQNGLQLITNTGEPNGKPMKSYLKAIDGHGQEGVFYGYNEDNIETPKDVTDYFIDMLQVSQKNGNSILVIDYCSSVDKIKQAELKNENLGFISFIATERDLTEVPMEFQNRNDATVEDLGDARNFLFALNYEGFESKTSLINTISATDYDMVVIDLFFNDGSIFQLDQIAQLKVKPNGGKRKVICYMSIGEAEDYRYYWQGQWQSNPPSWLDNENKNWPGNYKVQYWDSDWQALIYGSETAYLDRVLAAGFDGVYLDIIDAFEYFENK